MAGPVAVNVCRDMSRNPWRTRTVALEHCPEPSFAEPGQSALYEAVLALPAKYRRPLYLYYYEGYSVAETGESAGAEGLHGTDPPGPGTGEAETSIGGGVRDERGISAGL